MESSTASLSQLEPRRIRVSEYHRMIEAGILDEDERVELLEGVIVTVSPQSRRHAYVIQRLNRTLLESLGPGYEVLPQLPLTVGEDSEPEPDLAVLRAADAASREEHPRSALLVIEVAAESLQKDRTIKAVLYSGAGILEYWIVNLVDECVEVHRDPDRGRSHYTTVLTAGRNDELRSSAVPGIAVRVDDLFS